MCCLLHGTDTITCTQLAQNDVCPSGTNCAMTTFSRKAVKRTLQTLGLHDSPTTWQKPGVRVSRIGFRRGWSASLEIHAIFNLLQQQQLIRSRTRHLKLQRTSHRVRNINARNRCKRLRFGRHFLGIIIKARWDYPIPS